MKSFHLIGALVVTVIASACSFHITPSAPSGPIVIDPLSTEQHLRSDLTNTWSTCRPEPSGSTRLLLSIGGGSARLLGNHFSTAGCAGEAFETYRMANMDYADFNAVSRFSGTARIETKVYFPTPLASEKDVVRFDQGLLKQARVKFVLTGAHLQMTLTEIKVVGLSGHGPAQDTSKSLVLELDRLEKVPVTMVGGLKLGGLLAEHATDFKSATEGVAWLHAIDPNVIDPECINNYLNDGARPAPSAEFGEFAQRLLSMYEPHGQLTQQGLAIIDAQMFDLQDGDLNHYVAFVLDYFDFAGKGAAEEKGSSFFCPLKSHAKGIRL